MCVFTSQQKSHLISGTKDHTNRDKIWIQNNLSHNMMWEGWIDGPEGGLRDEGMVVRFEGWREGCGRMDDV